MAEALRRGCPGTPVTIGLHQEDLEENRLHVIPARSAPARPEIQLQVVVALGHPQEGFAGRGIQRRPSEVGVDDHARGVENPAQGARLGL